MAPCYKHCFCACSTDREIFSCHSLPHSFKFYLGAFRPQLKPEQPIRVTLLFIVVDKTGPLPLPLPSAPRSFFGSFVRPMSAKTSPLFTLQQTTKVSPTPGSVPPPHCSHGHHFPVVQQTAKSLTCGCPKRVTPPGCVTPRPHCHFLRWPGLSPLRLAHRLPAMNSQLRQTGHFNVFGVEHTPLQA